MTTPTLLQLRGRFLAVAMLAAATLAGCGGGGDDGGSPAPAPSPGTLDPSSSYAARCRDPRSADAIDPYTGEPYGDVAGSVDIEKNWVRAWIDETYLWYREVPNFSPSGYATPVDYFDVLKTHLTTASGRPKDQFHFTYATDEWIDLSFGGITLGYGMQFAALSTSPPRRFVIAYVDPGTPAAEAGLARGAELQEVDGVDFLFGNDVDTLNAALFPAEGSGSHTFVFRGPGGAGERTVTMTPERVTSTPVQNVKVIDTGAGGKVGYLQFNDHIATAEAQLIRAVDTLKAAGPISDLVLDIRYNGGGLLAIASELATMIAGTTRTSGRTFEKLQFNDKNPFGVTDEEATTPFYATAQGFSTTAGRALPTLGLGRVFVLTGPGTCSASEAIINGLRGVDVEVVQIGDTTCGKPYGFFPTDNCSTTYFTVQFQGVNAKGFGDYADGFVPGGAGVNGVPGCVVDDDFSHPLGDPAEAQLAAALGYRDTGACVAAAASARNAARAAPRGIAPLLLPRTPMRENRFVLPRPRG